MSWSVGAIGTVRQGVELALLDPDYRGQLSHACGVVWGHFFCCSPLRGRALHSRDSERWGCLSTALCFNMPGSYDPLRQIRPWKSSQTPVEAGQSHLHSVLSLSLPRKGQDRSELLGEYPEISNPKRPCKLTALEHLGLHKYLNQRIV